jgi:hypothetical protein
MKRMPANFSPKQRADQERFLAVLEMTELRRDPEIFGCIERTREILPNVAVFRLEIGGNPGASGISSPCCIFDLQRSVRA